MPVLKFWNGSVWTPLLAGAAPSSWLTLPLASGMVAWSAAMTPQYRFEPFNMVRLRGWVKPSSGNFPTTSGTIIATLPAGAFNPFRFADNACAHTNVGSTYGNTVRVEIDTATGNILIQQGASYPAFGWVALDGWTFPLEA